MAEELAPLSRPMDTMRWSQFKTVVDKALADANLQDAPIRYMDFSYPEKGDGGFRVSFDDEGMVVS